MKPDFQIATEAKKLHIKDIASLIGLDDDDIEQYGSYKAKISAEALERTAKNRTGKLVLVTAVNPTPAGEGKTTTTIGIGQAMAKIGKNAVIALREPSLGPVFGIKGGAAGGGYSQVVPMDEINLHFTGDFHAITSANNLLCAMIDNHLQQGNSLGINPKKIVFPRVMDMNDRSLRNIVIGLGAPTDGMTREDHFTITVASEIMAVLCLSKDINDLKTKLGSILIGYTYDDKPVYARQLKADGAMSALLKDAIKPNLVQTVENTPCIVHGGPFANIAHGCNSVAATNAALKLADYCITEAGFGADLGAEKFLDIKCRKAGLKPDAVVIVATVRALKYNGGLPKDELGAENLNALKKGISNLDAHIENIKGYGFNPVVALNHFYTDTDAETGYIIEHCKKLGVRAVISKAFENGGNGAIELAEAVCAACEEKNDFNFLYQDDMKITEKIEIICKKIYKAAGVDILPAAAAAIKKIEELGYGELPVCIAKTQYSLSDDPKLLGCPSEHRVTIREVKVCAGAGFVVAIAGNIMTMPGLPKAPSAEKIDVDEQGLITGIF